jgi:hypothetical protein
MEKTQTLSDEIKTDVYNMKLLLVFTVKKHLQEFKEETESKLNHYPKDIFMEVTKEELLKINLLLMKEMKFPIDRLSAHISRIVENNCKEELNTQMQKHFGSELI